MNLAQLQAAVITETNRPDLVAETLQSVLEATLSCHTLENFKKDLAEATVVFDTPTSYIQKLDTTTIPYFRSMHYIRKTNPLINAAEINNGLPPTTLYYPPDQFAPLVEIDPTDLLDMYGYEKRDVWYQAGTSINIKSSTPLNYAVISWYKFPILDATGVLFNSWIANENPYVIVYKAAGTLFAKIGEDKSWAIYMKAPIPGRGNDTGGLYYQQLNTLLQNNISTRGF